MADTLDNLDLPLMGIKSTNAMANLSTSIPCYKRKNSGLGQKKIVVLNM